MNVIFPSQMDGACDSRQLPSFEIEAGVPSAKVLVQEARHQVREEYVLPT